MINSTGVRPPGNLNTHTAMKKLTIWEVLQARLGRNPTNAECRAECLRILAEARKERNKP